MEKKVAEHILKQIEGYHEKKTKGKSLSKSPFYDEILFDNSFSNCNKKIAFIDGGSAELFSAPNFSLYFMRLFCSVFQNNRRILQEKKEFYLFIIAKSVDGKILYETTIFPFKENFLTEDFFVNLSILLNRFYDGDDSISKIGDAIRKRSETYLAEKIAEKKLAEIIILDGDLSCKSDFEIEGVNLLLNKLTSNNVLVAGLSKTTTLLDNEGDSVVASLYENEKFPVWTYYDKMNDDETMKTYFVKLHNKSEYVFKMQTPQSQEFSDDKIILSHLIQNSRDSVFLGYPYGLIFADRFARVQNTEKSYLQNLFIARFGEKHNLIKRYLNSINAHKILDSIR